MQQLSKKADKALNELSSLIGKAEGLIQVCQKEKDNNWEQVKNLLREFDVERFIANDGSYLQLQRRQPGPKLNEDLLKGKLSTRIWEAITVRKVDPALLESAVLEGLIPQDVMEECLTETPPTEARVRQPWTAEDKNRARVLGLVEG